MAMKSMVADWLNLKISHGKPFYTKHFKDVSRMLRLCKFSKENEYDPEGCYCAASLITSKHALTAFHCVDGDMESETYTEKSCELRDFSKREFFFVFKHAIVSSTYPVTYTWTFVLLAW